MTTSLEQQAEPEAKWASFLRTSYNHPNTWSV